jgi:hypothetical protein
VLATLAALTVATPVAWADAPYELMRVTSDNSKLEGLVFRVELVTDGGKLEKLIYHTFDEDTLKPKVEQYNLTQVNSQQGIDMVVRDGHKVVKLHGAAISGEQGGKLRLNYLYDGVTGERRDFWLAISKNQKGDWHVHKDGRTIRHLFFKTNKRKILFGKEVGVKSIEIRG